MPPTDIVLGIPPSIEDLRQKGLIERAFHDGLYPKLKFIEEAAFEPWQEHMGTEVFQSKPGLLAPIVTPQAPGTDPIPQQAPYEQWNVIIKQYSGTMDTHTPTSAVAAQNIFLRNIHTLGLQAGQSKNRITRDALFKPYLSGQTVLKTAALAAATVLDVASISGFVDVILTAQSARPTPVSTTFPLTATVGTGATKETVTIVQAVPDAAADLDGPGKLFLLVGLVNPQPLRAPVKSAFAPRIVRPSAGDSVDAITAGDTLVMQQLINAAGLLRKANVQPHEDGYFHCHLSPMAQTQLYADPVFQRLNQSLPDSVTYRDGLLGELYGILFYENNENPDSTNVGALKATGAQSFYASAIGAEVTNATGVQIGRAIITGRGALIEKGLDEEAYLTEAGVTGKIGEFNVINGGVQVQTKRTRLVIAAPLDRLMQFVRTTWSFTAGWAAPSDQTAPGGNERFRRAVVLEFAGG